jgi:phosphotransferase system HPr-like phosphotransfer protein
MTINAKFGEPVTVRFEGEDEEAASVAVEKLFADKFGEK